MRKATPASDASTAIGRCCCRQSPQAGGRTLRSALAVSSLPSPNELKRHSPYPSAPLVTTRDDRCLSRMPMSSSEGSSRVISLVTQPTALSRGGSFCRPPLSRCPRRRRSHRRRRLRQYCPAGSSPVESVRLFLARLVDRPAAVGLSAVQAEGCCLLLRRRQQLFPPAQDRTSRDATGGELAAVQATKAAAAEGATAATSASGRRSSPAGRDRSGACPERRCEQTLKISARVPKLRVPQSTHLRLTPSPSRKKGLSSASRAVHRRLGSYSNMRSSSAKPFGEKDGPDFVLYQCARDGWKLGVGRARSQRSATLKAVGKTHCSKRARCDASGYWLRLGQRSSSGDSEQVSSARLALQARTHCRSSRAPRGCAASGLSGTAAASCSQSWPPHP